MDKTIKYTVGFKVDKTELDSAKKTLESLASLTLKDLKLIDSKATVADIKEVHQAASTLQTAMENAFNPKLNTISIDKFKQSLNGVPLSEFGRKMSKAGAEGQNAFRNITSTILTSQRAIKQTSKLLDSMKTTFINTIKWSISSSAINAFTGSIQRAWGFAKALDTSLNDIRIVTEKSSEDMEKFAKQANKAAKALGSSTTAYTNASLIYYQQGLSDKDVSARTDTTIKAAKVTGQSAAEVSEQLTAVWNGYKVVAEEAELYVDKLAAVAASTAADLEELSTGMSKVASAANAMGVDMDQLTAQMATIVSVTRQDAAVVGTALKTIFARMGDLKVDGVDEFGTSLGEVSGQLQQMGINVLDQQGNLRDMGTVIEEVAAKWGTWTEAQQQAAAVAIAGKRQYNNLIALFENWDMYESSLSTSQGSEGTLQKQHEISLDKIETKLQTLSTTAEKVFDSFIDSDSMKELIDVFTWLTERVGNFVEAVGGGGNILLAFGGILTKIYSKELADSAARIYTNISLSIDAKREEKALNETTKDLLDKEAESVSEIVALKKEELKYSKLLTEQQKEAINSTIEQTKTKQNEVTLKENQLKKAKEIAKERVGKRGITVDPNRAEFVQNEKGKFTNKRSADTAVKGNVKDETSSIVISQLKKQQEEIEEAIKDYEVALKNKYEEKKEIENKFIQGDFDSLGISKDSISSDGSLTDNAVAKLEERKDKANKKLNKKDDKGKLKVQKGSPEEKALKAEIKQIENLINKNKELQRQKELLNNVNQKIANGTIVLTDKQKKEYDSLVEAERKGSISRQEFEKSVQNILNETQEETQETIKTLEILPDEIKKDKAEIDGLVKKGGEVFDDPELKVKKITNTISNLVGNISMAVSAFSILNSSTEALYDENLSGAEKAEQFIMGLLTSIPMLIPIITTIANLLIAKGIETSVAWTWVSVIAAILMALMVGLAAIKNIKPKESELEKAQKHLDEMKQSVQDLNKEIKNLQEEYDNLISKFDSLDDQYLAIDKMIKGTEEWNNAVIKLNSEVLELLDKYPELAEYISTDENGILTISQEGYDALINKQRAEIAKTSRQQVAAQIGVLDAETEVKETALDEKIEGLGVDRKEFIGAVTEAYKENRELFVDSTKDNGAFNEDSAFYKYLQDTFIPNYLGEDSTSNLTVLLANRLTENADAIKDLIDTNEKNTVAMKALRKSYLTQLAEEMGVNDKETYSNVSEKDILKSEKTVSDFIENYVLTGEEKIEGERIGDKINSTNDKKAATARINKWIKYAYGVENAIDVNDLADKGISNLETFKNAEFKIGNETVKGSEIINKAAGLDYENEIKDLTKKNAAIISELEKSGMDTRLTYFMNGNDVSSWGGMNVADLKNIQNIAAQSKGKVLIDTDGDGIKEEFKIDEDAIGKATTKMEEEITTALQTSFETKNGKITLGSIISNEDLWKFSEVDLANLKENFTRAFLAAGDSGVTALQNVFSQAAGDPDKTLKLNNLLKNVDFTSIDSVAQFAAECEKIGINIDFSTGAWADFINEFNSGIALAAKGIDTLRKALAFLSTEIQGLSIGDIIDEETFQKLMRLDPSAKDSFVRTSTGYMAVKSGVEIANETKGGSLGIGADDKLKFSAAYGVAKRNSDRYAGYDLASLDLDSSEDVLQYAKAVQLYGTEEEALLNYFDPTGAVERNLAIVQDPNADKESTEYKAALQNLKLIFGNIKTFVGNVENGVITEDELDKIQVTDYATSWSDAKQMARNRAVGWDTLNDTGTKYWRAQYLAEMGAETDAILKNLNMDELEDHIERVRELEQDRYSDIEKDIERLGIVAENSIGQKKIEALGEIAEEKSALTAIAEERMLTAQTNADNYNGYLRELGINPDDEDVIKKLQDKQLKYGKDSAKWNEIQLAIDALALEENTVNEYLQKVQEEIDAKFVVFDTALEISLDLTQAQRDWNEFKTKYIKASGKDLFRDLNAAEEASIADFNYNSFLSDYDKVMNSIAEAGIIIEDGKFDSALEGSADKIEEYLEKASGSFESAIGAAKDMLDAYNSMQDEIMEAYEKQIEKLSNINSLYSNSVNLLKLIGGTTGKYSEQVNKFLNQTSVNAKKSSDLALEQLTEAQNAYNRDYDKADEETKRHLEENLQAAADKVLETSNTLAEAIANQFKENFIAIFDEVFSGESLKSVSEEWNRELYFDERYLDETNKAYRISELERKIQESIDSTDSYSAQKKLNELRERELKALREKDKLTEADLERAEASYELELKRIALEEAQQTATKMKLTRDAMGNYSYQYVADKDAIDKAQSEYDAAENNLYNLYKDQEKETISELIGKYEEAMEAIGSAQTAEEKDLLFEHYFGADGVIALLEKDLAAIGIDAANSEVYTNPYKETISKLMSANNDSSIRDQYDKLMNSVDEQTLGFRESFASLEDTLDSLFAEGGSLTTAISNLSETVKGAEDIDMSSLGSSASGVLTKLFGENGDEGIAKILQERGANLGNYIDAALSLKTDANTEALNENTLAIKSLTSAIVLQADASDGQMDNKAYDRDLSGLLNIEENKT